MRLTSVTLAVLVAVGLWYWFSLRQSEAPAGITAAAPPAVAAAANPVERPPVPVMVLESRARPTVNVLTLRGRTTANRTVSVTAETAARVISEPLHKGTAVHAGDVLCRLDPGARPAQLLEAEARLAEAKAEFEAAAKLRQKGFASETTRIARKAQYEAAQAAVNIARLELERLEIRAPFSGVLETDTAEIGSFLAIGGLCATIIDLSSVRVSGYVSEQEVDRLVLGQPARGHLVNGEAISGRISFIGRVADPQTRTYLVEVTVPNQAGRIRDGMTAELRVELPAEFAHHLPQSALTLDDEGRLGVRIAADGRARFAPVTIVREETDGVWVSGLPDSVQVIVVGQEFVRDGGRIRATPYVWANAQ